MEEIVNKSSKKGLSESDKSFYYGATLGFVAAVVGSAFSNVYSGLNRKIIPNIEVVDEGIIAPSRLEIEMGNYNNSSTQETIVKVDEVPYMLREIDGEPVLSRFMAWSGHRRLKDGSTEPFYSRYTFDE